MSLSKRSQEGYLLIDHSASPGLPGAQTRVEMPTYTCKHCCAVVLVNPQRTRARPYCQGCDHYICDRCEPLRVVAGCRTFQQLIDQFQDATILGGQHGKALTQ